jgi:hypothetical protein
MDVEARLAAAVKDTSLAGRELFSLAVPMSDEVVYGVPIESTEIRAAWAAMRRDASKHARSAPSEWASLRLNASACSRARA